MPICRICRSDYTPFISFGQTPLANGFLDRREIPDEYYFELAVGHCGTCGMAQLLNQPDPAKMFHDHYAFFSSTSTRMAEHFREFAEWILRDHTKRPDSFVVEIGSNDGILLKHIAKAGVRHLGVEPSGNVGEVGRKNGVNTITEYFSSALVKRVLAEYGQADAIVAANVMCHIPDLHSVVAGIKELLAPRGIVAFEDPYLGDIVEKTSYDQIYDEHVFFFSASSIEYLFAQHGLELIDVLPQNVHGGSMRYVLSHKGARSPSPAVAAQKQRERELGLSSSKTYEELAGRIRRSRSELVALLSDLRRQNKRVVGYAATSKSTTVTNYCGITPEMVEYICDTTPTKQGKLSPGAHIPIRPHDDFASDYPDYALLFGWNHAEEIMAKESAYRAAGGKWIVYVPKVAVVE
jgi:methylation protein EvaC